MDSKFNIDNVLEKSKIAAKKITTTVTDTASDITTSTKKTVVSAIETKKLDNEKELQKQFETAMLPLIGTEVENFITSLEQSPLKLTPNKVNQIKSTFPIPCEQVILWADAEFDLRPSGIVLTDKGIFIRTNVSAFDGKKVTSNFILDELTAEEKEEFLEHHAQFHSGKAVLLYYNWNDFDAGWFISDSEFENKALLVEPQCSKRFIDACRAYNIQISKNTVIDVSPVGMEDDYDKLITKTSVVAATAVESSQTAIFAEQKSRINTPAGHGEMAEEAITMFDKFHGLDAKVIGRDNAKDGADRQIGDIFIQTKYYNSARGSLEACFNPENGGYRYMKDGQPMQLEVPKDQYQKVLEGFERKIEKGKVPGVTDPKEAANIVRKGRLTYQQAVNLTKPGTIEALTYDALTGVVSCSCSFGITFVVTVFLTWRKSKDIKQAIQAGASAGLQVFGISFVQHMLVSQIARTGLANSLLGPSQYVVGKLGYQTSATIVNGIRTLSGKSAIYGAAASKHLAKILRSNVMTSALSFAVFSVPETYNLAAKKISGAQYVKNMSVLAGSIAAGTGGAVASGMVAAKVAGVVGTTVAPGIGTVIGIAGGFIGGTVGGKAIKIAGDVLYEDDVETYGRLFNAYVSCMIGEYLLDEIEIDKLVTELNEIEQKEFKQMFERLGQSKEQELVLREFLNPYFESIAEERAEFVLPSSKEMMEVIIDLM